jgi:hypothetical protein
VFSRIDARTAGLSEEQVRRRAARRWDRLRRGQFVAGALDAEHRWRALVLATMRAHRRPLVLSHASAARAWGLPSPLGAPSSITFTTPVPPPRRAGPARVLVAALPDDEVRELGAVRVTDVARTVVDCARRLPSRDGLAIADAALHRGLTDLAELARVLERQRGWPNVARARQVLDLADGRRETPFESWSASAFAVHEVPPPMWQVTITDALGAFLGRVDGWWPEGVAGEADGDLKYRLAAAERGGATAQNLASVADDERRRERGLRRAGVVVVRWSAADVLDPRRAAALAATLREELARADGSRFTGRALLL